jgi:hypothetical protein
VGRVECLERAVWLFVFLAACFILGAIIAVACDSRIGVEAEQLKRAEAALIERMQELGREQDEIDARLEALRRRYKPEEK